MIEIYAASHGGLTTLEGHLGEYETLDQLIADASSSTGIPAENILLFLEDGRDVKDEVLQEIYERGGEGGQSEPPVQQLFLFNRETFYASSAETWAAQYQEELVLPPPLNPISDLGQAQQPFIFASDHLQHLLSLFTAQTRALSIAYTSLSSHLQPLLREFAEFQERAKLELENEDRLLRSSKADMAMLPRILVHEAFNKKKDRRDSVDGTDTQKKTMENWVNPVKMQQVRDSCLTAHETHTKQYQKLANQIEDLAVQSDAERRAAEERSQQVSMEFEEGLARLELAIEQLVLLFQEETPTLSQDLMELDSAMREDLCVLTDVKNDFTLDLHIHLRQVADFQIRITELINPIHDLDSDLQSRAAFPHLHRLHQLPLAYAATVIEIVRRKELATALQEWTERLRSSLVKFTDNENARRAEIRRSAIQQLPFPVPALDDTITPEFDLTVTTGSKVLSSLGVDRGELDTLRRWIENLKQDQQLREDILDPESDPIPLLEDGITGLIARMDEASSELDQLFRTSMSKQIDSHADPNLESKLRTLTDENATLRQQLSEQGTAHRASLTQIEETHQQRYQALHNRQAELQEELVRLRTDLEEEMLARQGLTTDLEERIREHERDHEDQAEVIASLQVDMVQEKDRATDLGVRLQEALLDVDGLKSAEQAHVAQVQSLQDERSKLLQQVSDVQNTSQQLESQIAGMKAELDATTQQLDQARMERDAMLKDQTAEAERVMRDHIAEADGDRAVLEHQNLTLTKQVEDLRIEMEQKITAVKNTSIRTADGLKAELSFTKAQLRDSQRRETVIADELAMAKDTAQAMTQKDAHQADVAKDAVTLAAKYYDTCQRIMSTIAASSTISASTHITRPKSPQSIPALSDDQPMRDSILVRSLATAGSFDLANFSDAVNKTISLVKKLNKSCRHYRDHARNKISFTAFAKGDLALFLPTRNATTRPWMAYNVSAPHHFLKVQPEKAEAWKNRDSIIARIVGTEEAEAGDTVSTNPFGLAEGLRFYIHQVEEYTPSSTIRTPRRSASTAYTERPLESAANVSELFTTRPSASEPLLQTFSSPAERKDYFPLVRPAVDVDRVDGSSLSTKTVQPYPNTGKPLSPETKPIPSETPKTTTPPSDTVHTASPESQTTPAGDPAKLSPVFESFTPPEPIPAPPPTARPAPPFAIRPASSGSSVPVRPPSQSSNHARPPSQASTHARPPSTRSAFGSSVPKKESPLFAPASFGRPVSVASSGGSWTQPSVLSNVVGRTSLAPAMALTTSADSKIAGSSGKPGEQTLTRKASMEMRGGPAPPTVTRVPSSGALFSFDDFRASPEIPSPLSREISRPDQAVAGGSRRTSTNKVAGLGIDRVDSRGSAGTGTSPSENAQLGTSAQGSSKFWTLGRKSSAGMTKRGDEDGGDKKQTARDILKRFDQ